METMLGNVFGFNLSNVKEREKQLIKDFSEIIAVLL